MIRSHRARITAALIVGLASVAPLFAISGVHPPPAFAHDQLVRSSPEDGSALEAWPATISLEFSDRLIDIGAAVHLVGQGGTTVAEAPPTIDGSLVTQIVPAGLPDGFYRVLWRVVSNDGHPISGAFKFTVGAGKPASSAAPSGQGPQLNPSPPTGDEAGARPDNRPNASDTAPGQPSENGDLFRRVLIALVGAAIGIALYWVVALRRARQFPSPLSTLHVARRRSAKKNKEHTQ